MVTFSQEDNRLRKIISVLLLIFSVILPIINNFGISLWCSYINGDIMQKNLFSFLSHVGNVFDSFELFVSFALIIAAFIRYGIKNSKKFIILFFARTIIVYASYFIIAAILYGNIFSQIGSNLVLVGINIGIDILLFVGVSAITQFLKNAFKKEDNTDIKIKKFIDLSNPLLSITFWSLIIISLFLLSGIVASTVSDIYLYGADNLTKTEIIYLVSPYINWLIKCIFGYVLMFFTAKYIEKTENIQIK